MLSKGGRLALIKSTLDNLPIYYTSLATIPKGMAKRLEVIQICILWSDTGDRRKYHLVAWSEIKKPMHVSGLGMHSMVEMNETLQDKWL